jgi:hypothetical protein
MEIGSRHSASGYFLLSSPESRERITGAWVQIDHVEMKRQICLSQQVVQ